MRLLTDITIQVSDSEGTTLSLNLSLIDTPGLNESAVEDLRHMVDIVKHVQRMGEIHACLLVIKFNSKIDTQYKATVEYYSRLLPFLFERNVIIVMTDYATDEISEKKRLRQNIDVPRVKLDTIREIVAYNRPLFAMDCLPDDDEERKSNLAVRNALLEYIHSLESIGVQSLRVAKTDYVRREDEKRNERLEGEISGYNARLIEVEQKAKEALQQTETTEKKVTAVDETLKNLIAKRDDLNTEDLVVVRHWSVNEEWRVLRWITREFYLKSPWEIKKVKTWSNRRCEWKDLDKGSHQVTGKWKGISCVDCMQV